MGHDRRQFDEALHSAKTFGERKHPRGLHEACGRIQVALQHERDHPSKSRVVHEPDVIPLLKPCDQGPGIGLVSRHPQMEGLQTTEREEAVPRARNRTHRILQEAEPLMEGIV